VKRFALLSRKVTVLQEHVAHASESVTRNFMQFSGPGRLRNAPRGSVRLLSDTIVIAVHIPSFEPFVDEMRINVARSAMTTFVVHAIGFAIAAATQGPALLNYRVAITWGEFVINENLLIGPAVDEVANLYERADAAVVDLTSCAAEHVLRLKNLPGVPPELQPDRLMFEYDIPVKCGHSERRWVVSPYAVCSRAADRHDVLAGIKSAFGEQGATLHATKYRNTMNLLAAASVAIR
jgi:hypothetical protein